MGRHVNRGTWVTVALALLLAGFPLGFYAAGATGLAAIAAAGWAVSAFSLLLGALARQRTWHPPHTWPTRSSERRHTVRRGESLWSIAEEQLGSAGRYTEILDLNSELLGMRPGFLTPGLVLVLPPVQPRSATADARESVPVAAQAQQVHTVRAGETLASIAAERLGSASRYPEILEASTDIIQPGGCRLGDTDDVEPGWKVAIPPRGSPPRPAPTYAAGSAASRPPWLNPGLERGGSLLVGALFLHWQERRYEQRRARRPGRTIAVPAAEVWDTEQTVRYLGEGASSTLRWLDQTLRSLSVSCRQRGTELPEVRAVEVGMFGLALHLAVPADPPPGWEPQGPRRWLRPRGSASSHEEHASVPPPYPLLVSVGTTVAGGLWLVNADSTTGVTVSGDQERRADFARHVALELATSPWSGAVVIEADTLDAPLRAAYADRDTGTRGSPRRVVRVLTSGSTTRVVADGVQASTAHRRTQVELTANGSASLGVEAVTLAAMGLSAPEAEACVRALTQGGDRRDVAIPAIRDQSAPWHRLADEAGGVLPQRTLTRSQVRTTLRETDSLLPSPDQEYLAVAATTVPDLQRIAPLTTSAERIGLAVADPDLSADLTAWFDPACPVPRVSLLGSAQVRAHGQPPHRFLDHHAEMAGYLLLNARGRTTTEVAEAFALDPIRARNDLIVLRDWLGQDPEHGTAFLTCTRSRASQQLTDAHGLYRIDGALSDLDLFRRLRLRAQSRGRDGIVDLISALGLVRGRPFSGSAPGAWSWLVRQPRTDEHIQAAVVDVAHLVTIHALHAGELDLAQQANETALRAAPDDDVPRWDQVAIEAARGHASRVDVLVRLIGQDPAPWGEVGGSRTEVIRRHHRW